MASQASAAIRAGLTALRNPMRADAVAALGELTGRAALVRIRAEMGRSATGRDLLARQPDITPLLESRDVQELPANTLGGDYVAYMREHGFHAHERPAPLPADASGLEPDLAWIALRYRQVHDIWHALAGLPPTVPGELALKWLEWVHTGLPSAGLAGVVASVRLTCAERAALRTQLIPWAVRTGRGCVPLMAVRYEDLLQQPTEQVRASLRFPAAPKQALRWAELGIA